MSLTEPQKRFLIAAYDFHAAYQNCYFSLWTFGHTLTGRALLRMGLIEYRSPNEWPFSLSVQGFAVAEKLIMEQRKKAGLD